MCPTLTPTPILLLLLILIPIASWLECRPKAPADGPLPPASVRGSLLPRYRNVYVLGFVPVLSIGSYETDCSRFAALSMTACSVGGLYMLRPESF